MIEPPDYTENHRSSPTSSPSFSSSRKPTTSIYFLPAELIHAILSNRPKKLQLAHAFLCAASLVCRDWREQSQKLLWKDASLRSEVVAERFLHSKASRRYSTRRMEILGYGAYPVMADTAQMLPDNFKGLKELALKNVASIDLCSENLAGLNRYIFRDMNFP